MCNLGAHLRNVIPSLFRGVTNRVGYVLRTTIIAMFLLITACAQQTTWEEAMVQSIIRAQSAELERNEQEIKRLRESILNKERAHELKTNATD